MNIYNDIEKATRIPCMDQNASFVRLKGPSKDSRRQRLNKHKSKSPQNENLLDDDNLENYNDIIMKRCLNENEIACSIKEANGGISYSNQFLERHWKSRQFEASFSSDNKLSESNSSSSKDYCTSEDTTLDDNNEQTTSNIDSRKDKSFESKEEILKKCKLSKNALIGGLIKSNKISIEDLQIPSLPASAGFHGKNNTDIKGNENIPPRNNANQDKYRMKLVPHPDDPEVFVQPLQAYGEIDESEYKEIDFTVPHVGTKKIVTARQFYINEMDDSSFEFVKKSSKSKK